MLSKPMYIQEENMINKFVNDTEKDNLKKEKKEKKEEDFSTMLFFHEYGKKNIVLNDYKLVELKQIAKQNKLRISGSKSTMIDRIHEYFTKGIMSSKIQSIFRGYIVRKSFKMRGEGFMNRKLCVNHNDFYSLEPLDEIPFEYFFTFKSNDDKFNFGCNIVSLLHLVKNKSSVKNPYNRETLKIEIIHSIIQTYSLIKLIFGTPIDAPDININSIIAIHNNINNNILIRESIRRPNNNTFINNEIIMERTNKLNTMRAKPMNIRIQELFMEIDQLGNYTNYHWFADLERRDYLRLYRILHDIWSFRGHLSREMKYKICILEDPFHEVARERAYLHDASVMVIKEICLKIFENMVYCGIDDEYRKIGTLHALSALTIVSENARNSMPWLYESIY
jgi:hypothetical protein